MSSCTSVLNTIGPTPSSAAVSRSCGRPPAALSTVEINGKVTGRNSTPSNCVSRLWPIVSAVTPVWSDTKKTVVAVHRVTIRDTAARAVLRRSLQVRNEADRCEPLYPFPSSSSRMTRCRAGRRQERLARRDDRPLADARRPRAGGSPPRRSAYRDFLAQDGLDERITPGSGHARCRRRRAARRHRRADPRLDPRNAFSARARSEQVLGGVRARWRRRRAVRGRGALLGHGRRSARSLLRRPAGNLPQRARRRHTLLKRMHEVFASLFNDRAIAYRVHQGFDHRARGAVRRHPAHGAQRPGRERRDVHAGYRLRVSATSCSSPPPTAWAKPSCRAR